MKFLKKWKVFKNAFLCSLSNISTVIAHSIFILILYLLCINIENCYNNTPYICGIYIQIKSANVMSVILSPIIFFPKNKLITVGWVVYLILGGNYFEFNYHEIVDSKLAESWLGGAII